MKNEYIPHKVGNFWVVKDGDGIYEARIAILIGETKESNLFSEQNYDQYVSGRGISVRIACEVCCRKLKEFSNMYLGAGSVDS